MPRVAHRRSITGSLGVSLLLADIRYNEDGGDSLLVFALAGGKLRLRYPI
jgi:hypothetical protein